MFIRAVRNDRIGAEGTRHLHVHCTHQREVRNAIKMVSIIHRDPPLH